MCYKQTIDRDNSNKISELYQIGVRRHVSYTALILLFTNMTRIFMIYRDLTDIFPWNFQIYQNSCSLKNPSKHIDVESTLIVNVHRRCFNVDIWLKMKVEPTYIFRRCFNVEETPWIKLRRFNVDYQTLFQRWCLVENESWVDVCLSTLFQRWQNNVETTLIELRRFNVDDSMLFKRRYLVKNESWTNACLPRCFDFDNICCTDIHWVAGQ